MEGAFPYCPFPASFFSDAGQWFILGPGLATRWTSSASIRPTEGGSGAMRMHSNLTIWGPTCDAIEYVLPVPAVPINLETVDF